MNGRLGRYEMPDAFKGKGEGTGAVPVDDGAYEMPDAFKAKGGAAGTGAAAAADYSTVEGAMLYTAAGGGDSVYAEVAEPAAGGDQLPTHGSGYLEVNTTGC